MGLDNPLHIAFLLVILLLVFGAKRLPEMGRSLGEGLRGFKDAIGGETSGLTSFGEHGHATSAVAQPHTAQPQAPTIAPAPGMAVITAPAPGAEMDPQLIAAARTLDSKKVAAPVATEQPQ